MNERLTGLLGMARRAGQLTVGFDAVKALIGAGKAKAVLLAADLSPKTEKELRFAAKASLPLLSVELSKEDIGHAAGYEKPVGVVATEDKGFADAWMRIVRSGKEDTI